MMDIDKIKSFVDRLKNDRRVFNFDEAATKQALILPLLQLLEWDTCNIDEVTPEVFVENRRVDYSLRLNGSDEVFIEVKKTGIDLEKHQEQLLDYSFRQGVELSVLTNGMTWWFYLPTKKGEWKTRKFYTIDVVQQETNDIAQKLFDLLSRANVQSGKAQKHAEEIYKGKFKKKVLEATLPEAWCKLISEPDSLLPELLIETTEKLCGFRPDVSDVTLFLKQRELVFLSLPKESASTSETTTSSSRARRIVGMPEDVYRNTIPASQRSGRKTKNTLSTRVTDSGKLIADFNNGSRMEWVLPSRDDKTQIRKIRDEVKRFAQKNEATIGQINAIRKALTDAGYHLIK